MSATASSDVQALVEKIYEDESRRVFATLVRLLGDMDLAEDALQEAFIAAVSQWPDKGIPDNPRAWLVSTGRFKAIDSIRKRSRFDKSLVELARDLDETEVEFEEQDDEQIEDDRLRLIFTCCHPALKPEARIALTLREVCGLTTEEIASAFLTKPPTLAQRIVRAKSKIRDAGIPYRVPGPTELPERLGTVLHVIYLVFNEGYSASSGEILTRADLTGEAIRLARLLYRLLPADEVAGLLSLMLLHESRRNARTSSAGDVILLENQDRTLWNRPMIEEGQALVERSFSHGTAGPYAIQAAIASVHASARSADDTDWDQIVQLYDALQYTAPSSVVELNRAVAVAMRDGPAAGRTLIQNILDRGELSDYYLAHSALGELYRRDGQSELARIAFERALALSHQGPERRLLEQRLATLPA